MDVAVPVLAATLRVAAPLLLAALAGLFSERSGIVDVGLEGKMLIGAFAASAAAAVTGSAQLGLLAAIAASTLLGLIHAYACVTLRGSQVVSGMAINIVASGLTATLALTWFHLGGQTPPLPRSARFVALLGGQTALAYLAYALVPLTAFVLQRTRFGLRLRACGEHPEAVDAAGISVVRLRYTGVLIASVLCGTAGTTLAIAQGAGFSRDMVAGRGFIALAALILGGWRAVPVMLACLLFGLLDAVSIRLQGVALPGIGAFPVEAIQALPYLLTVILLAGFVGRATRRLPVASRIRRSADVSDPLIAAALAARANAYAPYSRFAVGAALRTDKGAIHAGCNVENAAYPEGTCAEAGAIASMVLAGGRLIAEIVVAGVGTCAPCGGCRQKLREFGMPQTIVRAIDLDGADRLATTLADLLPHAFGPESLAT